MGRNKSEKINKVLNEENRDLNLHEIKAKTEPEFEQLTFEDVC